MQKKKKMAASAESSEDHVIPVESSLLPPPDRLLLSPPAHEAGGAPQQPPTEHVWRHHAKSNVAAHGAGHLQQAHPQFHLRPSLLLRQEAGAAGAGQPLAGTLSWHQSLQNTLCLVRCEGARWWKHAGSRWWKWWFPIREPLSPHLFHTWAVSHNVVVAALSSSLSASVSLSLLQLDGLLTDRESLPERSKEIRERLRGKGLPAGKTRKHARTQTHSQALAQCAAWRFFLALVSKLSCRFIYFFSSLSLIWQPAGKAQSVKNANENIPGIWCSTMIRMTPLPKVHHVKDIRTERLIFWAFMRKTCMRAPSFSALHPFPKGVLRGSQSGRKKQCAATFNWVELRKIWANQPSGFFGFSIFQSAEGS